MPFGVGSTRVIYEARAPAACVYVCKDSAAPAHACDSISIISPGLTTRAVIPLNSCLSFLVRRKFRRTDMSRAAGSLERPIPTEAQAAIQASLAERVNPKNARSAGFSAPMETVFVLSLCRVNVSRTIEQKHTPARFFRPTLSLCGVSCMI